MSDERWAKDISMHIITIVLRCKFCLVVVFIDANNKNRNWLICIFIIFHLLFQCSGQTLLEPTHCFDTFWILDFSLLLKQLNTNTIVTHYYSRKIICILFTRKYKPILIHMITNSQIVLTSTCFHYTRAVSYLDGYR